MTCVHDSVYMYTGKGFMCLINNQGMEYCTTQSGIVCESLAPYQFGQH